MLDFLGQTFITFLNMSITGSYIILAIMLFRLVFKKAPKIFSYCLWAIAGVRLLCKFSFSSVLSIFNLFSVPSETEFNSTTSNSYVPDNIGLLPVPKISTGINAVDTIINPILPEATVAESVNPMQIVVAVASVLWIIGMISMAVYGVISFIKVHKNIEFATKINENIFECEKLKSPFVFGIIKPKIYLPCGMDDKQREYVILHEKNHIKRLDHIIKLISFAVLMLHWYNPLVWLGYSLMIRDMEMSCDEKVLKNFCENDKKAYGLTLVSVGSSKKFVASTPLSFGENVVEERIVNILKFKKSKILVIILCLIACIAIAAICLTNAETEKDDYAELEQKVEEYIEKNNLDKVVAAEIVTVSIDNKAYCWVNEAYFDFSYSSYLNGKTKKEIDMFRSHVDEAIETGLALTEDGYLSSVMAEVHFDENMEVIHIEGLPDEASVDMGDKIEYTELLWKELADNAVEKLENAYGGKYNLKYAQLNKSDKLDKLQALDFELVEYLGNPVMVVKVTNAMQVMNTVQIPYYRVDSDFDVRILTEGSDAEGEILKRKDGKYHENSMYIIEGGSGKEYLCIYELAPYLDALEKNKTYFIDIDVETPFGEKINSSIKFSVKSDKTYDKRPSLTYDNIAKGLYTDSTEKIINPLSGWISQGYSNSATYALSEDELEEIENAFNQTSFQKKYAPDSEILYDEVYCVQIKADSGVHSIIVVSANTIVSADYSKQLYETNSEILCRTIAEIFYNKQRQSFETTTAAPDLPEDYVPQTKPPKKPDNYTRQPDLYTGVLQTTADTETNTIKPYFALSDIKTELSGNISNIELLGIVYEDSYSGGPHLLLTMLNQSDNAYYVKNHNNSMGINGFKFERMIEGQWLEYKNRANDLDNTTSQLHKNTFFSALLPIFELENGNYKVTLPIYENNEKAGDIAIEFTVTKYIKQAPAGSTIEKYTSFTLDTEASGMKYVITDIPAETKSKVVKNYNNFDLKAASRPSASTGFLYVEITDNKGMLHAFFIFADGTVYQSGTYFKPSNGKETYNLLRNSIK